MVLRDLTDSGADSETLSLWKSIAQWNDEGGPDVVEAGIMKKVRDVKSIAGKQLRGAKRVIPAKEKKRKTRR